MRHVTKRSNERSVAMRLCYLPTNGAFAFSFGDGLVAVDGRTLFRTVPDARAAAERVGLRVERDWRVTADEPSTWALGL